MQGSQGDNWLAYFYLHKAYLRGRPKGSRASVYADAVAVVFSIYAFIC